MGWAVPWYSSARSSFNYDFHVTVDSAVAPVEYNFRDEQQLLETEGESWRDWAGDMPGISTFLRDGDRVFHTYSTYARGLDALMGTYNWLDLTVLGRQEYWEEPPGAPTAPPCNGCGMTTSTAGGRTSPAVRPRPPRPRDHPGARTHRGAADHRRREP
jgi:hypothetical protein